MSGGTFRTSASQIESAIADIKSKKDTLSEKANEVSQAFTNAVRTVQLDWLNELITNDWNGTGNNLVANAKRELEDLMVKLDEIKTNAEKISKGA